LPELVALFFSTGAFSSHSPAEIAAECRDTLRVGLEFTSSFPFRESLVAEVQTLKGQQLLVHNYFPPPSVPFVLNLAATDPVIRASSHALCRQAIELSAELGAPFYSVHSGFAMNLTADQLGQPGQQAALSADRCIDRAAADRAFRYSVAELSAFARSKGVGLLLENNVITASQVRAGRRDSLLMTTPAECRQFLDDLADSNVGLLLDVGHAKVAGNALGFDPCEFFKLGDHLRALHLSDNDGTADVNQPVTKDSWFAPHLRDCRDLPMVVEVYRCNPETRIQQRDLVLSLSA
jgi:sugar phosphate isomerase/epimerase